jgi:hypothetical protein
MEVSGYIHDLTALCPAQKVVSQKELKNICAILFK